MTTTHAWPAALAALILPLTTARSTTQDARDRPLLTLKAHAGWVASLSYSRDDKRLASRGADATVKSWDANTAKWLMTLPGGKGVTSVAFSPDGKHSVWGSGADSLRIWEWRNGREIATRRVAMCIRTTG